MLVFSTFISIPASNCPSLFSTLTVPRLSRLPYMWLISGDLCIITERQITIMWSVGGWAHPAYLLADRLPFILKPDAVLKFPTCSPPIVRCLLSAPHSLSSQVGIVCVCWWVLSWKATTADILRKAGRGVTRGDMRLETQRKEWWSSALMELNEAKNGSINRTSSAPTSSSH